MRRSVMRKLFTDDSMRLSTFTHIRLATAVVRFTWLWKSLPHVSP